MMKNIICTICSKNYMASARTLMESLKMTMPDVARSVLLVDKDYGELDPSQEIFDMIWIEKLAIEQFETMAFQYNVIELNTAVKPFYLQYLLQQGYENIIYLDPDIYVYRSMSPLFDLLQEYDVLLTPHILTPILEDSHYPDETLFLMFGLYNLGFLAIKQSDNVNRFLTWWRNKLKEHCIMAHEQGIFVDQRWVDLGQIFFDKMWILKHTGFNVAYWNLHERLPITFDQEGKPQLRNNMPLYFYHFSGMSMRDDSVITGSQFQTRFSFQDETAAGLRVLFQQYRASIFQNGYMVAKTWRYAFNYFNNGCLIKEKIRRIFRRNQNKNRIDNPFRLSGNLEVLYRLYIHPFTKLFQKS